MHEDLPDLRIADAGGPVHFRAWDGPAETTFVLVHGLGGSHLNWVQVAPGLSGLGRVLALDLPGFGTSPIAGRGTGLMDLRRSLAGFIESEATGEVILAGNSMGGVLAVLQAAVEPEHTHGLILTCSAFPRAKGALPSPLVMGAFAATDVPGLGDAVVTARLRGLSPEQIVNIGLRVTMADPGGLPDDVVRLHEDLVRIQRDLPDAPKAFVGAARSLLRLGRRPDVAHRAMDAVRCPVLVLHGRRDRLVPARYAEVALAEHPSWRGRFFPDVGHVPQMEVPGRWLTEVSDWFSSTYG
ncbi:MAG: alpha/beta fold hydrolase [Actinomycetota bacterium]